MKSRAPLLPPSTNNSSNYSKTLQTASLRVQEQVSFFGSSPTGQQTIYPTLSSILTALQRYGFAAPGYSQEEGPIIGTGATINAYQGYSVALSTDGNTMAVGGYGDDSNIGAVWIYVRSGSSWIQQGSKLVGSDAIGGSFQGGSVSLSGDGNTLAVGGYGDDNNIGAVWIFTRTNGTWTQQDTKLIGEGAEGTANQGNSVSLSEDGNTLAFGGYNDEIGIGAVWVFTRTGGIWTQQGSKLVGDDYTGVPNQGSSVSLSADGNTLAIGGPADGANLGAVWIFVWSSGSWSQQGPKLVGSGHIGSGISQGCSVSLRGNTLVVGGYGDENDDNNNIGAVWVFNRSGTTWTQTGNKLVGTGFIGTYIQQGKAVSLSDDESTLILSGPYDNSNIGAVWIFKLSAGVWAQYGSKIIPTGYTNTPFFGLFPNGVAINGDSTTIAIGSQDNNSGVGATWVYVGVGV
jgi:hypothetical protein